MAGVEVALVPWGLIGDVTGVIPLLKHLNEKAQQRGNELFVAAHKEAWAVLDLMPKAWGIKRYEDWAAMGHCAKVFAISLPQAWGYTQRHPCYMSQAYFTTVGLPQPPQPLRPEFEQDDTAWIGDPPDYALAPFARSLPPEQKWPQERWQALVDALPGKTFVLLGSAERGDDPDFVTGPNAAPVFDKPLGFVAHVLRHTLEGLISVSTGPSHLAYAVGARNFLIINQGPFAQNPEAIVINKHIPILTVDDVLNVLREHARNR